jgi:hypothetical protein
VSRLLPRHSAAVVSSLEELSRRWTSAQCCRPRRHHLSRPASGHYPRPMSSYLPTCSSVPWQATPHLCQCARLHWRLRCWLPHAQSPQLPDPISRSLLVPPTAELRVRPAFRQVRAPWAGAHTRINSRANQLCHRGRPLRGEKSELPRPRRPCCHQRDPHVAVSQRRRPGVHCTRARLAARRGLGALRMVPENVVGRGPSEGASPRRSCAGRDKTLIQRYGGI